MCHHRLFFKLFNPGALIHTDGTEPRCIFIRTEFLAHNRDICFLRYMIFQYLIIIQLVHCITGGDDHIRFMTFSQEIKVLINSIRRSPVPVAVIGSDRRSKNEQAALLSAEIPPFRGIQMFI